RTAALSRGWRRLGPAREAAESAQRRSRTRHGSSQTWSPLSLDAAWLWRDQISIPESCMLLAPAVPSHRSGGHEVTMSARLRLAGLLLFVIGSSVVHSQAPARQAAGAPK